MVEAANEVDTKCANPDCRVGESGRCVEGLALDACPFYGRTPEAEEAQDQVVEDAGKQSVTLPSGLALDINDASSVLRETTCRVIAVIGPSDSGKTSLIASVYELFQRGSVEDIGFSRSKTLHAFEQTCHDARAVSRRSEPDTARTPRGQVEFYHLELLRGHDGERLVMLLGDRAGEEYREAADDPTAAARFAEVIRADTVTILVDGERLSGAGRHNVHSDVVMILQGLSDGGVLGHGEHVALVLTKLDAVQAAGDVSRVERDFDRLLSDVRRHFQDVVVTVEPFRVAASPKTDTLPRGTGVSDLLRFWLKAATRQPDLSAEDPSYARAFARLRPVDGRRGVQDV